MTCNFLLLSTMFRLIVNGTGAEGAPEEWGLFTAHTASLYRDDNYRKECRTFFQFVAQTIPNETLFYSKGSFFK